MQTVTVIAWELYYTHCACVFKSIGGTSYCLHNMIVLYY